VPAGEFYITGGKCSTADVNTARSSNKRLSMEGNYDTVDDDMPKSSNKRLSMEGDYSTVDEARIVHYLATYRHFLLADMNYLHIHWFLPFVLNSF
jgi:hypothetical protein